MNNKRQHNFLKGFLAGIAMCALVALGVFAGVRLYQTVFFETDTSSEILTDNTKQKVGILENAIEKYYLDEVENEALEDGLYHGLVEALDDPYSTYYSSEELKDLQEKTQGIYYGIGARVSIDTETQLVRIAGVIPNTPAEEAGLLANDLIYKVEGESIQGMDLSSVVALIKGEEGTTVHITIIREGESDYLEYDVERRKVENETVIHEMKEEGIAYIQIAEFDDITTSQFAEAFNFCREAGMEGLILDLRGNPGGNMTTVCEIARMMLPEGLIVYTEDKYGNREEYICDGKQEFDKPLAVLIDGNSASASEILSGAIKDYGIGTLVGTTTFGKGIVQRIIALSDGSAVKLTVSKYYTPNGNNIHKIGIEPDVEVAFDAEAYVEDGTDNQLEAAIKQIKEKMN